MSGTSGVGQPMSWDELREKLIEARALIVKKDEALRVPVGSVPEDETSGARLIRYKEMIFKAKQITHASVAGLTLVKTTYFEKLEAMLRDVGKWVFYRKSHQITVSTYVESEAVNAHAAAEKEKPGA